MDARFPLFHFPPSLYKYITVELKKPLILVLNKQDLVDSKVIEGWKLYFAKHYPQHKLACFNSFTIFDATINPNKKRKVTSKSRKYASSVGRIQLFDAINSFHLTKDGLPIHLDIDPIPIPPNEEEEEEEEEEEDSDSEEEEKEEEESKEENNIDISSSGVITLGTVGHPNVGKSSLINGLFGKKVVSASRTPGHTKHIQTLFLTKQIVLCDCPGLVFPALDRPKALQILCGLFPIAQVREPFSAIRYLAERVAVEKIYGIQLPDQDEPYWTPYSICEAYAIKRGYYVKRGRPDVHRAGLELLRDCVDGVISISWPPPDVDLDAIQVEKQEKYQKKVEEEATNEDSEEEVLELAPVTSHTKKLKKQLKKKQALEAITHEEEVPVDLLNNQFKQTNIKKSVPITKKEKKIASKAEEWKDKLDARMRRKQ
jgi:ribosome biogenesis GTPase A